MEKVYEGIDYDLFSLERRYENFLATIKPKKDYKVSWEISDGFYSSLDQVPGWIKLFPDQARSLLELYRRERWISGIIWGWRAQARPVPWFRVRVITS